MAIEYKTSNMKKLVYLVGVGVFLWALASEAATEQMPFSTRVSWIPSYEKLLVANEQQRPLVWDIVAECPFYMHRRHQAAILDVLVDDKGRLAVSSDIARKIKVWDIATGSELHEIIGLNAPTSNMIFADSSRSIILGDWSGDVRRWSLEDFSEKTHFKAFDSPVFSVAAFQLKQLIVVGSARGELVLWDEQYDLVLKRFVFHDAAISALEFADDGKLIIAASDNGDILIWDHENDIKKFVTLKSEPLKIRSLDVSSDNQYILVGTETGEIYLIDLHVGEIVYQYKVSNDPLQYVKFTNNFEALLVDQNYGLWSFTLADRSLRAVGEVSRASITPRSMGAFNGSSWTEEKTGMEFSWVSGGCFDIGCDPRSDRDCASDNMPEKNICLDDYWIAKDEVSRENWLKVTGKTLPFFNIKMPLLHQDTEEKRTSVASGITWRGAQGFVCQINKLTRGDFRLPTEAEWEYACENAIETKKLKQLELNGDWEKNSPVNQKLKQVWSSSDADFQQDIPSWRGSVDVKGMHSGVSEWVLDRYSRFGYHYDKRYNPIYLEDPLYYFYSQKAERVKRGGSWDTGRTVPECINRQFDDEVGSHDLRTGMRLMIPIEKKGVAEDPILIDSTYTH